MGTREVNDLDFEAEVLRSDRPVLVDFGAEWCGPCRQLRPLLAELARERDDVLVVEVDVEASPLTAKTYGVRGLPTLIVFRDGEPVGRAVGMQPASSLRALLDG